MSRVKIQYEKGGFPASLEFDQPVGYTLPEILRFAIETIEAKSKRMPAGLFDGFKGKPYEEECLQLREQLPWKIPYPKTDADHMENAKADAIYTRIEKRVKELMPEYYQTKEERLAGKKDFSHLLPKDVESVQVRETKDVPSLSEVVLDHFKHSPGTHR